MPHNENHPPVITPAPGHEWQWNGSTWIQSPVGPQPTTTGGTGTGTSVIGQEEGGRVKFQDNMPIFQAWQLGADAGVGTDSLGRIVYQDQTTGQWISLEPVVDANGVLVSYNAYISNTTPPAFKEQPTTGTSSTSGTPSTNLDSLLALPGVTGHEFIGNQLILHFNNQRAASYDVDAQGNISTTDVRNHASNPGPGFIPLTGGTTSPVNALTNLDQEIFNPAALNAVRGQAGLDPLAQPVTQGSTLSQFLVNPGGATQFTGTSPSGQASALDFAGTLQGSPGFDPMNAGAQEVAARLALQNQQGNTANILGSALGGQAVSNDPIANAALMDQYWQMQQANIASGLTPAEAAFMTSRQLGIQPRAGLVDPLRQGGTLNPIL